MSPLTPEFIEELWGNPEELSPEDFKAFREWCQAFNATDDEYQEYYRKWVDKQDKQDTAAEFVRMLSYDCITEGSDATTGYDGTFDIEDQTSDGYVTNQYPYTRFFCL